MEKNYLTQFDAVVEEVKRMLVSMDYPSSDNVVYGIVEIINLLSDYHEEGISLFPEVIILKSLDSLKAFPCIYIKVANNDLNSYEFSRSIKMCAPLAVNGWHIYISLDQANGKIEYGVLTTERFVLSLSLYEQSIIAGAPELNCLYLRNVGNKVVEVSNVLGAFWVALNLTKESKQLGDVIHELVDVVIDQKEEEYREAKNYLEKLIHQAVNEGHGNLIAVVQDNSDEVNEVLKIFDGGIRLDTPIDFLELTAEYKSAKTEDSSIKLRSYATIVQSMLSFDGITLFTDKGKVIGYHFIVDNNSVKDKDSRNKSVQGGARTRAFLALKYSEHIKACFMRSQDGRVLFDKK